MSVIFGEIGKFIDQVIVDRVLRDNLKIGRLLFRGKSLDVPEELHGFSHIGKEKTRGEQEYIITQDLNGTYVFSSKDICMINHIHELVKAGIQSLKIEGRMKSILYISSIVRAYRQAIDHWADPSILYNKDVIDKELNIVSHREFCTGFFFEKPMQNANTTKGGLYKRKIRLAALVIGIKKERAILKVYNTISKDDNLEYIGPNMKTISIGKIILLLFYKDY